MCRSRRHGSLMATAADVTAGQDNRNGTGVKVSSRVVGYAAGPAAGVPVGFVRVYAGARRASVSLPQQRSPTSVALRGTSGAGTGGAARRRPRWRSPVEVGL